MRSYPFKNLALRHGADLPFPLSFCCCMSTCNMARGQEETSSSQAGHRRGLGQDTTSASSIISFLSMEELRSYCHILDNIDFKLQDGPTESTIGKEDDAVYFTKEHIATGL